MKERNMAMLAADIEAMEEQGYAMALADNHGIQDYGLRSEQDDAADHVCPNCHSVLHGMESYKGHTGAVSSHSSSPSVQFRGICTTTAQTSVDKEAIICRYYERAEDYVEQPSLFAEAVT